MVDLLVATPLSYTLPACTKIGTICTGRAEIRTMKANLADLNAFVSVARAGGFRDGARANGLSASGLSEAVRRLEAQLGVRLLNRTTRSVVPTEAGARLLERLGPALAGGAGG